MFKKDKESLEVKENTIKSPLLDKKVQIALIKRKHSSIYKDEDLGTLSIGGKKSFACPIGKDLKHLDPLTREERMYLEELTGENLNIHSKNNFYSTKAGLVILHKVGRKTESATITLDLSNPYDFIKYKIAQVNPRVAKSWDERFNKKQYEFVLKDIEAEEKEELKYSSIVKDIQRYLIKNEDSKRKLFDLLRMYGLSTTNRMINYEKTNTEFLYNELLKLTHKKSDAEKLHKLVKLGEKDVSDKVFLADCISLGHVLRPTKYEYKLDGGDKIGSSEEDAIAWFNDKINRTIKIKFQQEIEDYYKDK